MSNRCYCFGKYLPQKYVLALLFIRWYVYCNYNERKPLMKNVEIGPIRPPSESSSLLVRVTRGCHWNKCYFCGLYKSMQFSMRPIEETIEDIARQAQFYKGRNFTSCFLQDGDALVLKPTICSEYWMLLIIISQPAIHYNLCSCRQYHPQDVIGIAGPSASWSESSLLRDGNRLQSDIETH